LGDLAQANSTDVMSQPIDPIARAAKDRRSKERRQKDRRKASSSKAVVASAKAAKAEESAAAAAFAAQLIGQGGQKRGLRAGPPALEQARSAYLGAEWLGPNDRRARAGKITKTEI